MLPFQRMQMFILYFDSIVDIYMYRSMRVLISHDIHKQVAITYFSLGP